MSDVLTTRDGLVGNSPRYTGGISPTYKRFLKDDAGAAINLTGISPNNFTITFVNQSNPTIINAGTGTWTILDAVNGEVSYQYGNNDLSVAGNWYIFVTCQLLSEPAPRVFDPDLLSIFGLPTPTGGTPVVTIENINLSEINGAVPSASNPLSVSIADGANVAQGTTTDSSSANTTIGLLKAIKAYLAGTLTISGTVTATNPSVGSDGSAAPASSTQIGASDGTNLQPLQVDGSKNLKVNVAAGTINASNPSVGTDGSAIPTSSTLIGASDGTNLQQLTVESASQRNLRVGLYSAGNEASVSAGGAVKVDNSGVTQPVSAASLPLPSGAATAAKQPAIGTAGSASTDVLSVQGVASMTPLKTDGSATTQPVSGTVTANAGTGNFTVAQATGSNLHAVLDAGSAVIGHVISDSGSTTAATQATASNLNAQVVGAVASAGSNAGNPVKIAGVFNTTQPTVTNGQIVDAQATARGAQIVAPGVDGFSVTANAGTNLNTSALALETGGNLATLAGAVTSAKVQTNTAQINGVAPTMGNGVSGTGVQRVTIASDSTGQVALAAGSAVIGHVIADSGSTTAVTQATASNLNAQVVGSVASGASNAGNPVKVGAVFNTTQPTVTNGQAVDVQATARGAQIVATGTDTFNATINAALPAGTNVIGHVIADSGSTTAVTQATASNLNAQVVGAVASGASNSGNPVKVGAVFNTTQPTVTNGQAVDLQATARGAQIVAVGTDGFAVTANAGTNLNTSALALESGGNLATLAGAVTSSKVQSNVAQINGVAPTMGNGVSGTGVQRVTIASDSTGQITLASGANTIGALTANQSVNVAQVGGSSTATAASGVQKVGIVGNGGATVDSTVAAGSAPTNAVVTGTVYNSSAPAPTTGQAMAIQADQAGNVRMAPGVALATLSAWNSGTSLNATQTIFTNSGVESVLVQLTQTTTLTAGAITFEVSYDGSTWQTIPANCVLDPTSTTFAQISIPYTVQASTNKQFLLNMNGAQGLRIKLSTQITGTGTVTPNYALLPFSPSDAVIAYSPTAANFNTNVGQWAGATNSVTNPVITEPNYNTATRNGTAYVVALSNSSVAAGIYALSVFNNSTAKNVFIYSIKAWNNGGFNAMSVQAQTSNPSYSNSITPVNAKLGGSASAITTCTYSIGVVSPSGTLVDYVNMPGAQEVEVFDNGGGILLPANAANGVVMSMYNNASAGYGIVVKWIEY